MYLLFSSPKAPMQDIHFYLRPPVVVLLKINVNIGDLEPRGTFYIINVPSSVRWINYYKPPAWYWYLGYVQRNQVCASGIFKRFLSQLIGSRRRPRFIIYIFYNKWTKCTQDLLLQTTSMVLVPKTAHSPRRTKWMLVVFLINFWVIWLAHSAAPFWFLIAKPVVMLNLLKINYWSTTLSHVKFVDLKAHSNLWWLTVE